MYWRDDLEPNLTEAEDAPKAAKVGKAPVYPSVHEVFLDLDSPEALANFETQAKFFGRFGIVFAYAVRPGTRPGHYHAVAVFDEELTPWQRLALQAALGTDPKHHTIACVRAMRGELAKASVLFEAP